MENKNAKYNRLDVKKLCGMAMFSALAVIATFLTKWIEVFFLTFDAKDAVITIAAYVYGPLSGVIMGILSCVIETLVIPDTRLYGLVMNIISSVIFSFTASFVYKLKRNINGAIVGIFLAVIATTFIMLLANYFITPIYLEKVHGMTEGARAYVVELIPTLLLPFNMAKALMNGALAMFLYRPLLLALSKACLINKKVNIGFNKNSIIIIAFGTVFIIASIVLFVVLMQKW